MVAGTILTIGISSKFTWIITCKWTIYCRHLWGIPLEGGIGRIKLVRTASILMNFEECEISLIEISIDTSEKLSNDSSNNGLQNVL